MPTAGITLNSQYFGLFNLNSVRTRALHLLPMKGEKVMKAQYKIAIAMAGSFVLGALAVQGLHAKAKPPR